jgi:hypothetical protein
MNTQIVPDDKKVQLINFINLMENKIMRKHFLNKELNSLRNKYIYKDICKSEYIKDVEYLKNVKEIVENFL